jgi:chromosome segregation ATPase
MGLFTPRKDEEIDRLTDEIAKLRGDVKALHEERKALAGAKEHQETINRLRTTITELKIEKSKLDEDHEREKREVEHLVGLQRRRQDFEVEAAKRDTELAVREGNLKEERKRFDEQMKFIEKRLEAENTYVREMLEKILNRVPTVTVDRSIEETYGRTRQRKDAKEA